MITVPLQPNEASKLNNLPPINSAFSTIVEYN